MAGLPEWQILTIEKKAKQFNTTLDLIQLRIHDTDFTQTKLYEYICIEYLVLLACAWIRTVHFFRNLTSSLTAVSSHPCSRLAVSLHPRLWLVISTQATLSPSQLVMSLCTLPTLLSHGSWVLCTLPTLLSRGSLCAYPAPPYLSSQS